MERTWLFKPEMPTHTPLESSSQYFFLSVSLSTESLFHRSFRPASISLCRLPPVFLFFVRSHPCFQLMPAENIPYKRISVSAVHARPSTHPRTFKLPPNETVLGGRRRSVAAPLIWNTLPLFSRSVDIFKTFKSDWKTHMFRRLMNITQRL